MDPLETLLRPALGLVNRQIAQHTPARDICNALDGRIVAIRVRDSALAVYVGIDSGGITPSLSYPGEPDAVITGSIVSLGRMLVEGPEGAMRDGRLEIDGDTELARQFGRLLEFAKPDVEERLSTLIGDAGAHHAGEIVRGIGAWGQQLASTLGQNLSEYVTEERRDLPTRGETEAFYEDVDHLRDDAERLEARLRRLEQRGDS